MCLPLLLSMSVVPAARVANGWPILPRTPSRTWMEMRAIFRWRIYCPRRSDCREQGAQIAAQSLDRSHTFFQTIEFRICDVAASMEDTLAIAALCQALVATLTWLHKRGMSTHVLPRNFLAENKWRAMRYALDAPPIDFLQQPPLSMRHSLTKLLPSPHPLLTTPPRPSSL